jgi:hypothetical protein
MEQYPIYPVIFIAGLILGYIVMWIRSRRKLSTAVAKSDLVRTQNERALADAAHQLDLAQVQNTRVAEESTTRLDMAWTQNAIATRIVEHELGIARMQNVLASAAIDSRRGDYESARQASSSFFTSLRDEANLGDDSSLSQGKKMSWNRCSASVMRSSRCFRGTIPQLLIDYRICMLHSVNS